MHALSLNDLTQDFVMASYETCSQPFLDALIASELVHTMQGNEDLMRRMGAPGSGTEGRRSLFAFRYKEAPVAFVTVAYTDGVPKQVQQIITGRDFLTSDPNTAVPYSISNCKSPYTKGVFGLGRALILRVRQELAATNPTIQTVATLSPLTGFRAWVASDKSWVKKENGVSTDFARFVQEMYDLGLITAGRHQFREWAQHSDTLLSDGGYEAHQLKRLALGYILFSKQNPVSEFHCANGAFVGDIHVNADKSSNGIRQSFGLMTNYHYPEEEQRLKNVKSFAERGRAFCMPAQRLFLHNLSL